MRRDRFGCPPTLAERELIVCPFLPDTIGLRPEEAAGDGVDGAVGVDGVEGVRMEGSEGDKGNDGVDADGAAAPTPRTKSFELLTPALLPPSDWPFSIPDLMQLALGPPSILYPLDASPSLFISSLSPLSPLSNNQINQNSPIMSSQSGKNRPIMSSKEAYSLLFQCGVETVRAWARTVDLSLYATQTQKVPVKID